MPVEFVTLSNLFKVHDKVFCGSVMNYIEYNWLTEITHKNSTVIKWCPPIFYDKQLSMTTTNATTNHKSGNQDGYIDRKYIQQLTLIPETT